MNIKELIKKYNKQKFKNDFIKNCINFYSFSKNQKMLEILKRL